MIGLTMGGTAAFYTYTTYMQKFLKLSVKLTDIETTAVTGASLVFAMALQPLYGALSDRIGRKWLLIGFGVLGTVFTIPLLTALREAHSAWTAFLLIAAAWAIVSGYTSINAVVKAELFPAAVRATGVGLPYALTVSIFGGTVDSVALWFKSVGHESWFYAYLTGCIAVSWWCTSSCATPSVSPPFASNAAADSAPFCMRSANVGICLSTCFEIAGPAEFWQFKVTGACPLRQSFRISLRQGTGDQYEYTGHSS